jgi:hypothetical protein
MHWLIPHLFPGHKHLTLHEQDEQHLRDIRAPIDKYSRSIPDNHNWLALISIALRRRTRLYGAPRN